MFDGLDPNTAYIGLENPLWVGGDDYVGRVYGVDLVEYDQNDQEIARRQLTFKAEPYYPKMADLQALANRINDGRIDPQSRR